MCTLDEDGECQGGKLSSQRGDDRGTPWAHLDIAGTMQSDADDAWRAKGATGFGTRILIEVAREFRPMK
jgi:hypothetical protein